MGLGRGGEGERGGRAIGAAEGEAGSLRGTGGGEGMNRGVVVSEREERGDGSSAQQMALLPG